MYADIVLGHTSLSDHSAILIVTLNGNYSHDAGRCLTAIYFVLNQGPDVLDACRAATDLNVLPAEITADNFKGKMKKWRESTTTSPSGRHLGRYKALLTNLKHTTTEDNTPTPPYNEQQKFIVAAIVAIINYCIRNNYTLSRWKTVVNTMIFKESGNYKIHRLRVIHIYEADFNLLLAIKWQ